MKAPTRSAGAKGKRAEAGEEAASSRLPADGVEGDKGRMRCVFRPLLWWCALGVLAAAVAVPPRAARAAAEVKTTSPLDDEIGRRAAAIETKLIAWRRDIHEHPELGDQETRTSKLVADHLRALGLEVATGVARTGVVGVLHGGKPGGVVALRADMDALPVKEALNLPFSSKAKGTYAGAPGGAPLDLMHACGHDAHTAILMAVAEVLTGMKEQLPGTVKFLFQPAEEGPSDFLPNGKNTWGAKMMIEEGVLTNPKPDAIFGLHVTSNLPSGMLGYRGGTAMASADELHIKVVGRGTHGAKPWGGVDPITVAAEITLGLQTVISRQTDLSRGPAVVTIGMIHGGTRLNVIPDTVQMDGSIRSFDTEVRKELHERVTRTAEEIAKSAGATAEVSIVDLYNVTVNDKALVAQTVPTLAWAAGRPPTEMPLVSGSEDFSFFGNEVPGFFFFLGVTPAGQDPATAPANHSPAFYVDEAALVTGVRALAGATVECLEQKK